MTKSRCTSSQLRFKLNFAGSRPMSQTCQSWFAYLPPWILDSIRLQSCQRDKPNFRKSMAAILLAAGQGADLLETRGRDDLSNRAIEVS
jgi:hypothetical protein